MRPSMENWEMAPDVAVRITNSDEVTEEVVQEGIFRTMQMSGPDPEIRGMRERLSREGEEPALEEDFLWAAVMNTARKLLHEPGRMEDRFVLKRTEKELGLARAVFLTLAQECGLSEERIRQRYLDIWEESLTDTDPVNRFLWSFFTFVGAEPTPEEILLFMTDVENAFLVLADPECRAMLGAVMAGREPCFGGGWSDGKE